MSERMQAFRSMREARSRLHELVLPGPMWREQPDQANAIYSAMVDLEWAAQWVGEARERWRREKRERRR